MNDSKDSNISININFITHAAYVNTICNAKLTGTIKFLNGSKVGPIWYKTEKVQIDDFITVSTNME
jgi:hypothetical protein